MAKVKFIRYALVAAAALGVFVLTAYADGGDASPTTYAQPAVGAAAPYTPPSAAPYRYQPQYPREDLPCNPPGKWEVYPSPTTSDLTAVDFVDVNNGWACGPGVILRYRNGTWTEEPGQATRDYRDLDMVTTMDGWAVGREGTTDIWTIWRWDGSSWNVFQTVTGAIYCIDMIDANHGWIGGNGYFLRYNGTTWEWGGASNESMLGIHMFSDTNGRSSGFHSIMRRVGNNWVVETSNNNWNLAEIYMLSESTGWVSGNYIPSDKGILIKYDGTWKEYEIVNGTLSIPGLDFNGNSGWCCGWTNTAPPYGAFLSFYDGDKWLHVKPPTDKGLLSVDIINNDNGWVVGEAGVILKYKRNVSVFPSSLGRIKAIYR